jgi:hypothetical protein
MCVILKGCFLNLTAQINLIYQEYFNLSIGFNADLCGGVIDLALRG